MVGYLCFARKDTCEIQFRLESGIWLTSNRAYFILLNFFFRLYQWDSVNLVSVHITSLPVQHRDDM